MDIRQPSYLASTTAGFCDTPLFLLWEAYTRVRCWKYEHPHFTTQLLGCQGHGANDGVALNLNEVR